MKQWMRDEFVWECQEAKKEKGEIRGYHNKGKKRI